MTKLMDHIEGEWDLPPPTTIPDEGRACWLAPEAATSARPRGRAAPALEREDSELGSGNDLEVIQLGPEIGGSLAQDLAKLREELRLRHRSWATEKAYVGWLGRFLHDHGGRDARGLQKAEIEAFLNHLAAQLGVSVSTQNQALNAL